MVHQEWKPVTPSKPPYLILVRAGKDRDATRAAVNRFYDGWGIVVESLGGTRDPEEAYERARSILREDQAHFVMYIGGREDAELVEKLDASIVDERFAAISIGKKRVRNARLEEIFWGIERARAKLRLRVGLDGDKILVHRVPRDKLLSDLVVDQPFADVFIGGRGWVKWLSKLGACLPDTELVILERLAGGRHLVYDGLTPCCELHMPDEGIPSVTNVNCENRREYGLQYNSLLNTNNYTVTESFERISLSLLRDALARAEEVLGYVDAIVVPWSGGKDSTMALYLAVKAYGASRVVAIYVDTGVDFPQNIDYINDLASRLGIEVVKARAPVREFIPLKGMPRHDYRWCTGLKLETLESVLRRLGEKLVVVTGDRDAESEPRSRRPLMRVEESEHVKRLIVTPLKQWSTILLQLYAKVRGLELNPLYELGFYRLGCYICPALRSWEKLILAREPLVAARLVGLPYYRRGLRQG